MSLTGPWANNSNAICYLSCSNEKMLNIIALQESLSCVSNAYFKHDSNRLHAQCRSSVFENMESFPRRHVLIQKLECQIIQSPLHFEYVIVTNRCWIPNKIVLILRVTVAFRVASFGVTCPFLTNQQFVENHAGPSAQTHCSHQLLVTLTSVSEEREHVITSLWNPLGSGVYVEGQIWFTTLLNSKLTRNQILPVTCMGVG